ncbi:hypothetical protein [Actinophytocola sp.]|nr:hypothetical protein [Actinophytocola sp.]HYQ69664.1 hypothetical protein [Actinophytocola sp.]
MAETKGTDPIDERVPTPAEVAEDERFIDAFAPAARAALTDDEEV